ncbi:MAG: hypothetical protein ACFB50_17630 [Rubrobacteraceae bacterium]
MQSAREEIRDLERVRYVTENYEDLQGLRRVPIGLLALGIYTFVVFTGFEIRTKFVADIVVTLAVFAGVVLLIAYFGIRRYYENRYGRVRVVPRVFRRGRTHGFVVFIIIIATAYSILWMREMQAIEPYPFSLIGLGTMEVFERWPEKRFRPHRFVLGTVLTLSGFILLILALQGNPYSEILFLHLLAAYLVLDLVVGGILDHLLLVRTMKRLPEDSNAVC